jgi:hypothetical protein
MEERLVEGMAEVAEMLSLEINKELVGLCSRILAREELSCDSLVLIMKNLRCEIEDYA